MLRRYLVSSINFSLTDRRSRNGLPTEGLLFFARPPGMTDSIGLSVADYLSIRSELRSIFFIDATTKRADEDIVDLIIASEFLNEGLELVGNALKGFALYAEGAALLRAYRYFGETYSPLIIYRYLNTNHYSNMEHYI